MSQIDRRLLEFLLYDWLAVQSLTARPRFAEHSRETFDAMLDAAAALAEREFAPHNRTSDLNEPHFDGERVFVIPEIKRALDAFIGAGFMAPSQDAEYGGLQLPVAVEKACFAYFQAANLATSGYAFLTLGNAELLLAHASPAQIDAFARPELAGRFFGTMCLSEPQAGSSLSDIRTRAVPDGDSPFGPRYRLFGNKMWISGGEHELAENIVHLVLAKIPDASGQLPPGVKGISIFIVPRKLVNADGSVGARNDVSLAGLNHKLGYRGTVNTLLNFGEGRFKPDGAAGAIGYRIGEPGEGLRIMFHMMNGARIGVGMGATMLGYAGYRYALQYAKERPQGRSIGKSGKDPTLPQIPIIRHADVKRMLLAQKAYSEGALALNLYCARLVDEEQTADREQARHEATQLLDILTPIAKSWPSEWCQEANSLAIQVLGGYGYTRDYPVEQYWRDNRLNMIHEGTHGIQALDLIGRKVILQDGALMKLLAGCVMKTATAASAEPSLQSYAADLQKTLARLGDATRRAWAQGEPEAALANATPYMQAFGHSVLAWIWLDLALAALRLPATDKPFATGVLAACRFFYIYEMPKVAAWLAPVEAGERLLLDTPEDAL